MLYVQKSSYRFVPEGEEISLVHLARVNVSCLFTPSDCGSAGTSGWKGEGEGGGSWKGGEPRTARIILLCTREKNVVGLCRISQAGGKRVIHQAPEGR